jgi:hypothetical protein
MTLKLTLKKKWFDLVGNGKEEEYREIKPFWERQLVSSYNEMPFVNQSSIYESMGISHSRKFDKVLFANGGHFGDVPKKMFECNGIEIREGREEWGAEKGKKYFVIKLGKQITL